ncbi:MAG: hypothetical protein KC425_16085, partial [Anaerolineales bacterium]|nr:hypothetical protein [Anaerolineales bacterium]
LFTFVPFGGAGPLHACELARALRMPRVLVPPAPGVLSALGMLVAAPTKDYSRTVMRTLRPGAADDGAWLDAAFAPLAARARAEMAAEGHPAVQLRRGLDVRYRGQSHELAIPLPAADGADAAAAIRAAFDAAHAARYGYAQPGAAVEVVTVRLTAVAPADFPELAPLPADGGAAQPAPLGEKAVWFSGQPATARLYDRAALRPGQQFSGPAVVFQYDTTTVVPPGWETAVDAVGNLLLTDRG